MCYTSFIKNKNGYERTAKPKRHAHFLYEDEEVVQLLAVELDGCCGDDGVDVLDDRGGLARLQTTTEQQAKVTVIEKETTRHVAFLHGM